MKNIIVNTDYDFVIDKLIQFNFNIIPVIKSECVTASISAHSDVLYNIISNDTLILSACQMANLPYINQLGYKSIIFNDLSPGYKTECGLNFFINDSIIIKNPKTAINIDYKNRKVMHVKQGYTRCSTLQINNNSFITDDVGIYNALKINGYNCLHIKKGIIDLKGYDYGFIGGASINLLNDKILFCGDILDKDVKYQISKFIFNENKEPIFINNHKITDIGSGIII